MSQKQKAKQVEMVASVAHEVNRAYCQAMGDMTQPKWEDAPEWQKKSAIAGVMFHIQNPRVGPAGSHDEWARHKVAEGWKYGPEKNPEAKEHPCLVPFDQLAPAQQVKDYLFRAVVHAITGITDLA